MTRTLTTLSFIIVLLGAVARAGWCEGPLPDSAGLADLLIEGGPRPLRIRLDVRHAGVPWR